MDCELWSMHYAEDMSLGFSVVLVEHNHFSKTKKTYFKK